MYHTGQDGYRASALCIIPAWTGIGRRRYVSYQLGRVQGVGAMYHTSWDGYRGRGYVSYQLGWVQGVGLCIIPAGMGTGGGAMSHTSWDGYRAGRVQVAALCIMRGGYMAAALCIIQGGAGTGRLSLAQPIAFCFPIIHRCTNESCYLFALGKGFCPSPGHKCRN
ncbi:hypothetical protein XENTR_v10022721 [Xenopus tropicalis]|nr:hypothetical protein XENTR_v10022721 [Xenopus tropicalis]